MKRTFKSLFKNDYGVAAIEFAVVFPIMFLLLFGAVEVGRYILIIQKVEKSAYALTNILTQIPAPTEKANAGELSIAQVQQIMPQFDRMMSPYGTPAQEAVLFTSILRQSIAHAPRNAIRWQAGSHEVAGAGSLGGVNSIVNGAGAPFPRIRHVNGGSCPAATFPSDAAILGLFDGALDGENVIVGEVFFQYRPIVTSLLGVTGFGLGEIMISRRFFMYPRNGDLIELPIVPQAGVDPSTGGCV